jgi:hypothetical protein
LKSIFDDGIVVHSVQEKAMPPSARPKSSGSTATTSGNIAAVLEEAKRRLRKAGAISTLMSDSKRRIQIIEEEHLRRDIARHSALREKHPDLWGELEKVRKSRNRETAALNRRLRAEGLRPVRLEPSLEQRVKKLQQLEARESARTATPRKRS